MASNINRVVITGNLVRDPELRALPSGAGVCNFSIAVNSREKRGEEWVDRVDFFDCVVFGKLVSQNLIEKFAGGLPRCCELLPDVWRTLIVRVNATIFEAHVDHLGARIVGRAGYSARLQVDPIQSCHLLSS